MWLSLRLPILCGLPAAQTHSQTTGELVTLTVSFLARVHSYKICQRAEEQDTLMDVDGPVNFSTSYPMLHLVKINEKMLPETNKQKPEIKTKNHKNSNPKPKPKPNQNLE